METGKTDVKRQPCFKNSDEELLCWLEKALKNEHHFERCKEGQLGQTGLGNSGIGQKKTDSIYMGAESMWALYLVYVEATDFFLPCQ